jgi:hypothetical protein
MIMKRLEWCSDDCDDPRKIKRRRMEKRQIEKTIKVEKT